MKLEENSSCWIRFDNIESTNDFLLNGDFPSGTVCLAKKQYSGRGQGLRRWYSTENRSFIFSGLLKLSIKDIRFNRLQLLPLLCGLSTLKAAIRAVEIFEDTNKGHEFFYKWPNDIYLRKNSKTGKLAGILVETVINGSNIKTVIGIGLNWTGIPNNDKEFPNPAISLFNDSDAIPEPEAYSNLFISEFNRFVLQLQSHNQPSFIDEIRNRSYFKDKKVLFREDRYNVIDITEDGGLLLEDERHLYRQIIYETIDELKVL